MITPDEARNTMMKIESNDAYYGELQEELKLMATYITQQETKDKLLGLYQEKNEWIYRQNDDFSFYNPHTVSKKIIEIAKQIKQLEEELK